MEPPDATGGEAVVTTAIAAAADEFGAALRAAYALGSLAHGGFAPLVSDVDVCLVLDTVDAGTAERVGAVYRRVTEPQPLAGRLSVFWADPAGVRDGAGEHDRLPAADRLDLIASGRLLRGRDQRGDAVAPSTGTLVVEAARFAVTRFDATYRATLADPVRLVEDGVRATTKAVLFPVRFLYTAVTGRHGHNDDAAAWYVQAGRPGAPLVEAAASWRVDDLDATALPLLHEHLRTLYAELVDDHTGRLEALGETALAEALTALRPDAP